MAVELNVSSIENMEATLKLAVEDLGELADENHELFRLLHQHGWEGLDERVLAARSDLDNACDSLNLVAEKIGVGGRAVREAHEGNTMIRWASKKSLTGA